MTRIAKAQMKSKGISKERDCFQMKSLIEKMAVCRSLMENRTGLCRGGIGCVRKGHGQVTSELVESVPLEVASAWETSK